MKFNKKIVNKFFQNKTILYIILGISFLHLLGYLAMNNLMGIIIFLLLGFISSFYTKNMSYILLTPLIITNLLMMCLCITKSLKGVKEGLENKELKEDDGGGGDEEDKNGKDKKLIKKLKEHHDKKKYCEEAKTEDECDNDKCSWKKDKCQAKMKSGFNNMELAPASIDAGDDNEEENVELVQKDKSLSALNKIIDDNEGVKKLLQDPDKLTKYMDSMGPIIDKMQPMLDKVSGMMGKLGMNNN